MLVIDIPDKELFDEKTETFIKVPGRRVRLEYSLLALSKWESIYEKPFLAKESDGYPEKTKLEMFSFVECMVIGDIDHHHLVILFNEFDKEISEYIRADASATKITYHTKSGGTQSFLTNELVYYWVFKFQIDKSCEQWHLNRLLKLIEIFVVKENPKKEKLTNQEIYARNRALKAKRDAEMRVK